VCESFPTNNCISAEKNEEIGCGKLLYWCPSRNKRSGVS
jgi:hypothetical protein